MNVWSTSRRSSDSYWISLTFILFISECEWALAAISRVVCWQFVVELFFFEHLPFLILSLLHHFFIWCVVAENYFAFIVVLHPLVMKSIPLVLLKLFVFELSVQPKDQFDCPPGPWWTLTLVLVLYPILNSLLLVI